MTEFDADDHHWDVLARQALAGDTAARQSLVTGLWSPWLAMIRRHRSMGPLAQSEDHVHEVATRLLAKVAAADRTALRRYVEWAASNPTKTFGDWMRIVLANLVRDYAREQLGARPTTRDDLPSAKRLLNELTLSPLANDAGIRPPFTAQQTIRQLLDFAHEHLSEARRRALRCWLEGASFADIDAELGLPAGDSERLVRAGVAILRRRFATVPGKGDSSA